MAKKDDKDKKADPKKDEGKDEAKAGKGGSKKTLIIIIVAVVLAIAVSVGVTIMLLGKKGGDDKDGAKDKEAAEESAADSEESKEGEEGAPVKVTAYLNLQPGFVVTLKAEGKKQRYMQIHVSLMARDETALKTLETHAPVLRNKLVVLFSKQDFMAMQSDEGRTKLAADALTATNELLEKEAPGGAKVEQVLFTNFVMQ